MMQNYWVLNILVRCFSFILPGVMVGLQLVAEPCIDTAKSWRKTSVRSALAACAAQNIAPAQLAMAQAALDAKQFEEASRMARSAGQKLPAVGDVASWIDASAQFGLKNFDGTLAVLLPIWTTRFPTPLYGKAAILGAQAAKEKGDPRTGVNLLKQHSAELPQPQGDYLLGELLNEAGSPLEAATTFQRVYFGYPTSPESVKASGQLAILRMKLGSKFPGTPAATWLDRIARLLPSRPGLAREDINIASASLAGPDKELVNVRMGAADYFSGAREKALTVLRNLNPASPNADAERLYYMFASAKRLDRESEMKQALEQLSQRHPTSKWRFSALTDAGYFYLLDNRYTEYEPIYAACAAAFPQEPKAAFCHWKVVWSSYLRHRSDAVELLRAHLEQFPHSEKANAALYFLGRSAERQSNIEGARSYYEAAFEKFPNTYYAMESRRRLNDVKLIQSGQSPVISGWLARLAFPDKKNLISFKVSPTAQWSMARARVLESAGLQEYGEAELRMVVRREGQSVPLAIFLAEMMHRQGLIDRGIRHIKGTVPNYLNLPISETGEVFWKLAFPMPYSQSLIRFSEKRSIDPYLMAGLVRQESEFSPTVVSHANAYGLTQVMPATGRELAQRLGLGPFKIGMLTRPEINLNMGTYYMRMMMDSLDNSTVETLAAYNAGRTRVIKWRTFGQFREPSEFIETITFDETRDYVQSVIRNGELYRTLYSKEREQLLAMNDPISPELAPQPPPKPIANKSANSTKQKTTKNAKSKVQKR